MKQLLVFSISIILSLPCVAQSYLVYTAKGDIVSKDKAKTTQIKPGDQLTDKTVLTVSSDGRLTVIDEKSESLYTVKEGIGTLSALIAAQQSKSRPVTPSFLAFVKEKVSTKNNPKDVNYMQAAGVTYRGLGKDLIPLQAGKPGSLLNPLRESFAVAGEALAESDADGLLRVSDRLDSLGLVRYAFQTVTGYEPRSFNGYFIFDPLCLMALSRWLLRRTTNCPEAISCAITTSFSPARPLNWLSSARAIVKSPPFLSLEMSRHLLMAATRITAHSRKKRPPASS